MERLAISVKRCIKKGVGIQKNGYIETNTALEAECIQNNRVDEVLTPNHLVYGKRLENVNLVRNADVDINEYSIEFNISFLENLAKRVRDITSAVSKTYGFREGAEGEIERYSDNI